jgi:hypothetical protein
MTRLTAMAIIFPAVFLAAMLATAGDGWAHRKAAARKPVRQEAARNPCAAQPCAVKAQPCAAGPAGAAKPAVARMVKGEIAAADLRRNRLTVRQAGADLTLRLERLTSVRRGPERVGLDELKAGQQATVSYVERDGQRTAKYIYLAAAAGANPCAAHPCAAKPAQPCAAQPCAPRR